MLLNVAAVEEKFRNKRAIAAPPLSRPLSHALVVVAPSLGQVSYRDLFWTRAARHGEGQSLPMTLNSLVADNLSAIVTPCRLVCHKAEKVDTSDADAHRQERKVD